MIHIGVRKFGRENIVLWMVTQMLCIPSHTNINMSTSFMLTAQHLNLNSIPVRSDNFSDPAAVSSKGSFRTNYCYLLSCLSYFRQCRRKIFVMDFLSQDIEMLSFPTNRPWLCFAHKKSITNIRGKNIPLIYSSTVKS